MAFFSFIIYLSKLRGKREECGVAFFNLFLIRLRVKREG